MYGDTEVHMHVYAHTHSNPKQYNTGAALLIQIGAGFNFIKPLSSRDCSHTSDSVRVTRQVFAKTVNKNGDSP